MSALAQHAPLSLSLHAPFIAPPTSPPVFGMRSPEGRYVVLEAPSAHRVEHTWEIQDCRSLRTTGELRRRHYPADVFAECDVIEITRFVGTLDQTCGEIVAQAGPAAGEGVAQLCAPRALHHGRYVFARWTSVILAGRVVWSVARAVEGEARDAIRIGARLVRLFVESDCFIVHDGSATAPEMEIIEAPFARAATPQ